MKKTVLVLGVCFLSTFSINAQEVSENAVGQEVSENALGILISGGIEASYQKKMTDNNRLEVNLALVDNVNHIKVTGLYQWVWNLEEKFNCYAGFGAGYYDSAIFGTGVVGFEYDFNGPLLISIDYRPEAALIGNFDGPEETIGVALRYQF
jgi:hypothetical protein